MGDNAASILDAPAQDEPARPALVMADGTVVRYAELADETRRWAATLAAAGIGPGDRVALADWGGLRSTAVTLAAAHLGAAAAQMNPLLTEGEQAQLVEVAGCRPVGVATAGVERALRGALGPDARLLDAPDPAAGDDAPRAGGGEDAALVLFTSGTTGTPKAVPVTHRALYARLSAYRPAFSSERPAGVGMMCVPSFHIGGLIGLLLAIYAGDTTVVLPRFDAGEWLRLVDEQHVMSVFLVPTMLARILDHPDAASTELPSLLAVSYGAAAAPVDLVRRAMERWPHVGFLNVFGQTETLGAYTTLTAEDHHDPARIGSVGRALPGVEVRVVDTTTGEDVPPGEIGELWVRAAQNVRDGWLETGDLARRDEDGYLYPTGRRSELINRGGEKFPPSEVAEALRSHPALAEAAVAGVPDPEMGERVGAVVVAAGDARPDLHELREWCRTRVAPFKLPELVVYADALPHNELGKLPRRTLVELILAGRPEAGTVTSEGAQ
jgi:long-chain acyl-CoA synthetase